MAPGDRKALQLQRMYKYGCVQNRTEADVHNQGRAKQTAARQGKEQEADRHDKREKSGSGTIRKEKKADRHDKEGRKKQMGTSGRCKQIEHFQEKQEQMERHDKGGASSLSGGTSKEEQEANRHIKEGRSR